MLMSCPTSISLFMMPNEWDVVPLIYQFWGRSLCNQRMGKMIKNSKNTKRCINMSHPPTLVIPPQNSKSSWSYRVLYHTIIPRLIEWVHSSDKEGGISIARVNVNKPPFPSHWVMMNRHAYKGLQFAHMPRLICPLSLTLCIIQILYERS